MVHTHSIYDTDKHFSIDPATRKLTSENQKNTVVQYDHNSERFTFELPRYIEGHDMSLCDRVEVHYLNFNSANKTESSGVYEVEDLQLSPADKEVVICSWLISQNVTKYDGSLSFLVRFACTDDTGKLTYAWNTIPYTAVSVSKGLYNSEAVEAEYADVLAQWEQRLFGINDDGVQNVTEAQAVAVAAVEAAATAKTQEVLESIPDDYKTLDQNVTEYKAKVDSLANAIKGTMTGAAVRADDVSPVKHEMAVKVRSADGTPIDPAGVTVTRCGKNIIRSEKITNEQWKNAPSYDSHGVVWTVYDDRQVAIQGETPEDNYSVFDIALSNRFTDWLVDGATYTASLNMTGSGDVELVSEIFDKSNGTVAAYIRDGVTFTVDKTKYTYGTLRMQVSPAKAVNAVVMPQIEIGGTSTGFEPYTGTTYTPLSDGSVVGVTSLSPTTTLLTDTPGAVVECEYNCDTNKVIADILDKIAALNA